MAYYGYTAATYLPPALRPTAPAPEVSGCRAWPWMRTALHNSLLYLSISYLKLSVTLDDEGARRKAGDARGERGERGEGERSGSSATPAAHQHDAPGVSGLPLPQGEASVPRPRIMGFHPHGIIPVAGGLMSLTG